MVATDSTLLVSLSAMSQALRLGCGTVPGYGPSESDRCPPCTGVFRGSVKVSTCLHSSRKCATVEAALLCRTDTKRNSDFSKHNKHHRLSFSQSWSRESGNRDGSESLSSKTGLSSNPKFNATAVSGPGEKKIVQILRNVQAKLREGAVVKEETKIEPLQGHSKETEAVDSLVKLLKKHAVEHGKRKSIPDCNSSGENHLDYIVDQPEGPKQNEEKSPGLFSSNSTVQEERPERSTSSPARPVSKFRHRSPIPQNKFASSFSEKATAESLPLANRGEGLVDTHLEPEVELEPKPKSESEKSFSNELVFEDPEMGDDDEDDVNNILDETNDVVDEIDDDEVEDNVDDIGDEIDDDDEGEDDDIDDIVGEIGDDNDDSEYIGGRKEPGKGRDMTALKVSELRSLAKFRGVKGFTKMKKAELVDILSGCSI